MSGLLNIGEMGALALHLMADLAETKLRDAQARKTAQELAASLGASVFTLQKVIRRLVMAGFLDGARGVNGGVRLSGDPAALSMLQILECVEGQVRTNGCLFLKRVCPENAPCRFHSLTEGMETSIREYFAKTTLEDLCVHR